MSSPTPSTSRAEPQQQQQQMADPKLQLGCFVKLERCDPCLYKPCVICGRTRPCVLTLGGKFRHNNTFAHHYCLLFSSHLTQTGEDHEGIQGFMEPDILKEHAASRREKCSYCHKGGATVICVQRMCRKVFHLPCGLENGSLHHFHGTFQSFCFSHAPKQKPAMRYAFLETAGECSICFEPVRSKLLYTDPLHARRDMIWASCCRINSFMHRICVQYLALNAGYHHLKCPRCCDRDEFLKVVQNMGIFVPERDATWELERGAEEEEEETRRGRCAAPLCLCTEPDGRLHDVDDTEWEVIMCRCCGHEGRHLRCLGLHAKSAQRNWVCDSCAPVMPPQKYDVGFPADQAQEASTDESSEEILPGSPQRATEQGITGTPPRSASRGIPTSPRRAATLELTGSPQRDSTGQQGIRTSPRLSVAQAVGSPLRSALRSVAQGVGSPQRSAEQGIGGSPRAALPIGMPSRVAVKRRLEIMDSDTSDSDSPGPSKSRWPLDWPSARGGSSASATRAPPGGSSSSSSSSPRALPVVHVQPGPAPPRRLVSRGGTEIPVVRLSPPQASTDEDVMEVPASPASVVEEEPPPPSPSSMTSSVEEIPLESSPPGSPLGFRTPSRESCYSIRLHPEVPYVPRPIVCSPFPIESLPLSPEPPQAEEEDPTPVESPEVSLPPSPATSSVQEVRSRDSTPEPFDREQSPAPSVQELGREDFTPGQSSPRVSSSPALSVQEVAREDSPGVFPPPSLAPLSAEEGVRVQSPSRPEQQSPSLPEGCSLPPEQPPPPSPAPSIEEVDREDSSPERDLPSPQPMLVDLSDSD